MDREPHLPADGPAATRLLPDRLWALVLAALFAWQAWMTLGLFADSDDVRRVDSGVRGVARRAKAAWARLRNDEPIISGQHPLHLYFGYLGAEALAERSTPCCYDPAFQAGYPKTPVFDSGSRPAELFLFLAGAKYSPAAYKVGLAVCSCLAPLLLALGTSGLRLGLGPTCLSVALGLLVWWGAPCRDALEDGDLDWLLAALAEIAYLGLVVRFDRLPDCRTWVGLLVTGSVAWFGNPFLCLLLLPVVLVYYLSTGTRHGLGWHTALLASYVGSLAVNAFWLVDWARYWWIRLPIHYASASLRHRTLQTFWDAQLWGSPADRALGVALFVLAVVGGVLLNRNRERPAARVFGIGAGAFWLLAAAGIGWQPLGKMGTSSLLTPALWFASPLAVYALVQGFIGLASCVRCPRRAAVVVAVVVLAAGLWGQSGVAAWLSRCARPEPLLIGLGAERAELVRVLRTQTSADSRILWEDRTGRREASRWSALLPVLTDRAFVGGLAPDDCIEHAQAGFVDQSLAGRPIADWTDVELDDYCRRYNVGWAVCWSPPVVARFRAWKGEAAAIPVHDGETGFLFRLQPRSFVLKGQGRWLSADRQHVTLADVVPEDGVVILSLHYQAGLQASPARVQVEREPDAYDPIAFVRLKLPGPMPLVTLTWEDR